MERARARVVADEEYLKAAMTHIQPDIPGWIWRRLSRGMFILWASDIPIRYTDINAMPPLLIRGMWLVQAILVAIAAYGAIVLLARRRFAEAALLVLPLLYVTGVHFPFLSETRQSLPVKPLVIVLAAVTLTSRHPTSPQTGVS
jgi:hypothetical protein